MKKKIIIIGVIVLIVGSITYKLAANKEIINASNKLPANNNVAIPVNTITTEFKEVHDSLIKSGTLIPFTEADITSVSAGRLTSVNFQLGDHVKQGQVIAGVDNSGLQLQLDAARLAESKAEKDFQRYQTLLKGEATTEINFQNAKLDFQNEENQIEQIQNQMANNRIKAPISGQVVSKTKESGEFVSPGTVLGHIVDVDNLKVDVMVNEQDVYRLRNNESVTVRTDIYPGVIFNGKIIFISQSGDAVHNYQVEVSMQNKKDHPLKAGSFAYVDFNQKSNEKLLLIPKSALIQSLDKPMVYVIENEKAVVRNITVGHSFGNNISVISGLTSGEKVVTSGLVNISNGTPVKSVND